MFFKLRSRNKYKYLRKHFTYGYLLCVFFIILVVPMIFRCSESLQRDFVFSSRKNVLDAVSLSNPESEGLLGTKNFYVNSKDAGVIGVWHLLPYKSLQTSKANNFDQIKKAKAVILYVHGNNSNRAREYRMGLYNVLRSLDFHVITFDYRGFGDSSNTKITKSGVVQDTEDVFHYIRQQTPDTPVIIWGHSLGSSIASHFLSELPKYSRHKPPSALILEAPFTNMEEEIKMHSVSLIWRYLPFFNWFFIAPLKKSNIYFETDKALKNVQLPILILHAWNDPVVPHSLGQKLYNIIQDYRGFKNGSAVIFRDFDEKFGHTSIYKSDELPPIVRSFVELAIKG